MTLAAGFIIVIIIHKIILRNITFSRWLSAARRRVSALAGDIACDTGWLCLHRGGEFQRNLHANQLPHNE